MAYAPFVPLRVLSAYSMLEGAIEPKAIPKHARQLGFPAVAITDRNGLYGVMAFEDGCRALGVQPIIGTLLAVAREDGATIDWLALYAQDETGYTHLCQLVSAAHLDRPAQLDAHVTLDTLATHSAGLIALTAGAEGALARLLGEGQADAAALYADRLQAMFGDRLYIELARRGDPVEQTAEAALVALADARGLPIVATNPAHYAEPAFHDAHDAMLCIAAGEAVESEQRRRSSPDGWLKPARRMAELFADLPDAVANTLVVAQRCAVGAPRRKPILPSLAGEREAEAAQLRADARAGLIDRLAPRLPEAADEAALQARFPDYFARLEFECDVIARMGFPGYFLIVADFIKWAKAEGIAVGPGRGSGAGSVVAWALTITDLDPISLGLLFERFLNPERVSMPDFDIDFCETRRGEVIRYVQRKYGRGQVAQIITFGKLKARAVLRDTGRVLQMSYGQVDRLCKLVPNHPTDPWDLDRAMKGVPELRQEIERDSQVARLFELARKLEGLPRHSSTHAAGVVIGDRPLAELVPLYRDPRSDMPVTQFDMKYVEIAGLVKFDFLGLKTLSVLEKALAMLAARGVGVDLAALPLDDPAVYDLLKRGETVGVFQLESEGMRRTLSAVKPTGFGDIIALVSLYRPGPMDNIPMFGRRKNGEEPIAWPHPLLEPVLAETYGIFVYQEQVMQAAQILAGYSLGEADLLRRAMGKKIKAEMDAQRSRFVEGCAAQAIAPAKANELFDLIDKFAGYGFNKSHAAAYALLAYHTAWLKAHHPAEFFAASMCYDMHQTDKLAIFVDDMRRLKVPLLPPDLNRSEAEFSVEPADPGSETRRRAVRYALAGLKNVGEKAMESLVAERSAHGLFTTLDDFVQRADPQQINRRSLETLIAAGAFDGIERDRARLFAGIDTLLAAAASAKASRDSGQHALFGSAGDATAVPALRLPLAEAWNVGDRMTREREAFGFYFSAHPVAGYAAIAASHGARDHAALMLSGPIAEGARVPATMSALIEAVRWRESRKGNRFAQVDGSDASGQFTASCFDEAVAQRLEEHAGKGACMLMSVELDQRAGEETPRVTIRRARPLAELQAVERLRVDLAVTDADAVARLAALLHGLGDGRSEIVLHTPLAPGGIARVKLGTRFRIDAGMAERLAAIEGVADVRIAPLSARLQLVR